MSIRIAMRQTQFRSEPNSFNLESSERYGDSEYLVSYPANKYSFEDALVNELETIYQLRQPQEQNGVTTTEPAK